MKEIIACRYLAYNTYGIKSRATDSLRLCSIIHLLLFEPLYNLI